MVTETDTTPAPSDTSAPSARFARKRLMVSVWCLPEEKAELEAKASAADLSLSRYLRDVGLGYSIRGTLDSQAFLDLAHTRGDLGRLGGLLKMWLSNDERLLKSHDPVQLQAMIERLLERIGALTDDMHGTMQRL